jgi:hypothetical protein
MNLSLLDPIRGFPVIVSPKSSASADLPSLLRWVKAQTVYLQELTLKHGAVLFRGFKIDTPNDFEVCLDVVNYILIWVGYCKFPLSFGRL